MSVDVVVTGGGSLPNMKTIMSGAELTEKDIVARRVYGKEAYDKKTPNEKKAIRDSIRDDSPAVIQVKQEINFGDTLISNCANNSILCAAVFTAPTAGMALSNDIPRLLTCLDNLGLLDTPPGAALLISLEAILLPLNTIAVIIGIINDILKGLMSIPLTAIGQDPSTVNLIPAPPRVEIRRS